MPNNKITGTWHLFKCLQINLEGKNLSPINLFGETPKGVLFYDGAGNMSAQLTSGETPLFESEDWLAGKPDEALLALKNYQAYYGTYSITGNQISHQVEGCVFPNWVGKTLVRKFAFDSDDNILILTAEVFVKQGKNAFELHWKRVN